MFYLEDQLSYAKNVSKRLTVFKFKHRMKKKQIWWKLHNLQRAFLPLLLMLFSPRIIVGLSMYFKEYLIDYIKPIKYLFFATEKKLSYKMFILSCLNFNLINNELVKINFSLFLFYEFYWKQIKCISYNSTFFDYSVLLDHTDEYLTYIMQHNDFLLRLTFKSFYYFFCYTEHFRLTKYNEYIITHISLSKSIFKFLLRKEYITLYFNWQLSGVPLAAGYVQGYRKGLLGKFYLVYYGHYLKEISSKFLLTILEFRVLILNSSFAFLYWLNRRKVISKFIYNLNRQAIRHTLRLLAYAQIMRRDRKWKWFHVSKFETLLDFIFFAFKNNNPIPIYKTIKKQSEKKLLNWQLRQSSICIDYFCTDLLIFKNDNQGFWERFFWDEYSLDAYYIEILITNIFNDFFIRIVDQLDFSYILSWTNIRNFYHRYRINFYRNLLFYTFPTSFYITELFFFGLDYFLWRVWYSYYSFNFKTLDVYNFTSTYDKFLLSRYFGIVTLFREIQMSLNFESFSLYVLVRDLIYKNIENEFQYLILIFFLNIRLKHINNNISFYDYKCQTGFYQFWLIAPEYEREINLNYITDYKLLEVKKLRKKSIQDNYIW